MRGGGGTSSGLGMLFSRVLVAEVADGEVECVFCPLRLLRSPDRPPRGAGGEASPVMRRVVTILLPLTEQQWDPGKKGVGTKCSDSGLLES